MRCPYIKRVVCVVGEGILYFTGRLKGFFLRLKGWFSLATESEIGSGVVRALMTY